MSEGGGVRSEGGDATRFGKVHNPEHKAVILHARPLGYVHPPTFQGSVGIKRPRFVNHTGYEVESKGRVDVIPTALAYAAEPAEGAKEVFHWGSS